MDVSAVSSSFFHNQKFYRNEEQMITQQIQHDEAEQKANAEKIKKEYEGQQ